MVNYYVPFMRKSVNLGGVPVRINPLWISIVMFAVAVQGAYFALQLTPPRKPEEWLPATHMWTGMNTFASASFYQPDYKIFTVVEFVWGIAELDISEMDIYLPAEGGKVVVWDQSFDLSTEEAQDSLLETCRLLQTFECKELEACADDTLMLKDAKKTHSCFLEDFKAWSNGTLPTGSQFLPLLTRFRKEANPKDYTSDILDGQVNYERDIGIVGGELKFVVVKVRSTIPEVTPYATGVEARSHIRDWVRSRADARPKTLNRSLKFMDTAWIFTNFSLAEELIKGFFSGCAIALPVAFLVLLFSTRNIVMATIAVLSVGSIVLCVLGFCKSAMDWDLGIGEAIAGVIVIGYSVDYVVHLAHTYCDAKHHGFDKRDERCAFAITNMGSTVFMGAVTTAGAGSIMFFCFLYFFFKMALLICVTIMYSFLFSLGFFMSVVWLIGPEGTCGDLSVPSWMMQGRRGDAVKAEGAQAEEIKANSATPTDKAQTSHPGSTDPEEEVTV